ncbi:hypothetical protein Tco_0785171 [Tanacetum coccineum]
MSTVTPPKSGRSGKNKKDEDQTIIACNKAVLVAKGYVRKRKSTSGGITVPWWIKLVSWMSKKHDCTAMSTAKASYEAYLQVCSSDVDRDSSFKIMASTTTKYHCIATLKQNIQLADMFTKALPEDRFKYLVRRIGMRCLTPAELEIELTLEQSQQGVSNDVLVHKLLSRVLRNIIVIIAKHPSDTNVFTMKMEILLEPASNKLLVGQTVVTATSIPFKCSIYKDILSRKLKIERQRLPLTLI